MSRHGYSDEIDEWALIRWRGQVASAMRGKRGQALLIDLVKALDAMPEKALIKEALIDTEGDVCALGAVGIRRGIPMENLDPEWTETIASTFDIAEQLAREITYINDEGGCYDETRQQRWERVRSWAIHHIQPVPVEPTRSNHDAH
jgi:hypothetical protein